MLILPMSPTSKTSLPMRKRSVVLWRMCNPQVYRFAAYDPHTLILLVHVISIKNTCMFLILYT